MLVLVRILALSVLVLFLDYLEDLGTSVLAICLFLSVGTLAGYRLAKSKIKILGLIVFSTLLYLCYILAYSISSASLIYFFNEPSLLHAYQLHSGLLALAFSIATISTFAVCRSRHALTLEVFVFVCGFIYFFAGHRDFNFQSPQIIGSMAWRLAISPLTLLSTLSILLFVLVLVYLRLSDNFYRSESHSKNSKNKSDQLNKSRLPEHWLRTSSPAITIAAILLIIGNLIFSHYKVQASVKTSMGVGQGKSENQSPLSFNSALGASNQPSAVVRLEGDYAENPFIPTLYFRESALSLYNGIEMVAAGPSFDQDIPASTPDSHFKARQTRLYDYRVPVQQSVFPLTDHKLAFAIDYPISINPLKNPDPKRFKAAYKAHSMSPAFNIKTIYELPVGDPEWDFASREHYLKINPDPRYTELANKISKEHNFPLQKAQSITDYLSEKTIYTLSPGHDLPANGDQTAAYLFGDMRGYCVHFAHALTYMFRSIGIPARVATGYQTDLSQSRDGHILLRMSDRHAWSEVFVQDLGWIPFDPKPQQVESHAETPVDMNLLEELMDLLGPSEEILPKDLSANDPALEQKNQIINYADSKLLASAVCLVILILFLLKIYLWNSWRLPLSEKQKARHYYRSVLARLYDSGLIRQPAETRQEYSNRILSKIKLDMLDFTDNFLSSVYSSKDTTEEHRQKFLSVLKEMGKMPVSSKLKSLLSINSIRCFLSKGSW